MSSDPNRPRPRSSKKRRAVQSGAGSRAGARATARGGAPGRVRAGTATPPSGGIPGVWLAIGAVAVFVVGVLLASGTIGGPGGAKPSSAVTGSLSIPSAAARGQNCPTTQPAPMPAGERHLVTISTAKGEIDIEVDGSLGPQAAGNFAALVSCKFYDGIAFHRLVPGFVIQGGDPEGTGGGGPGYEFPDDPVTTPYVRGTVAMANAGPDTNGSQFFIVLADQNPLSPNYSIFGKVTKGMEVVDAIAAMPNSGAPNNQALQPVAMDSVTIGPALAASPSGSVAPSASSASSPGTAPSQPSSPNPS